jgi:hypothetical protein
MYIYTIHQNREKYTKLPLKLPSGHKMYQMAIIYLKWPTNLTTFSIPGLFKIYPNLDFWFENKPSGNHGLGNV